MDVRHPLNQIIASILMGVMFLNPIVTRAAELTLDAAAGGNASLGQAANGVPLVNIATPNGSGLSHNKFTDYNVGQQGLILNNSAQALAPTQLGGFITGNPNLAGGAAGLILNEVTGSNASRLEGYTEVAGQAAHVIVANPHGITCDGCGFINTPKATLTTGTPQIDNGALKGYDVNGGSIAIEGAGLNAGNVGQFELITRAAEINAEIHAQQLTIVTGRNEVDAQTLAATAKADDGSAKPSVAIDSSALGGMYAGAIRLVGTEAGVGVKLAGDLAASGGDIRIDANGQLTMARSAAAGDLAIKAQDVTLQNDTFAAGSASIETNQLDVQESLAAGNRVEVTAQTLNNPGTIEAGVHADGSLNASAQLQLSGDAVTNSGKLISHGSLSTDLKTLTNPGEIAVAGNAQIKADNLNNSGQLIVQQSLAVEAAQTHNQGTLGAAGSVRIDSPTLTNENGLLFSGADMTLRSEGITNRLADILSLGALDIALDDQNGRSAYLENISGTLESAGYMRLAVDHLLNRKDRFAATQRRVEGQITLTGTDNCKGDHCEAAYLLQERYEPQISEDSAAPMLVAGGDLSFVGERFENRLGSVSAGGKIQIDADQFFNIGAGGGRERTSDYYIYTSSDAAYWTFINNMGQYNAYNDPNSPSYNPDAMSFESIALGVQRGGGWVDTSGDALVNAVVQAGGAVEINASQTLENAVIRPDGSGGAHLNRQLPPDLAQRLVDPLALPGFGLPAGSGLFRLNNDPGHRYLIESNPAFASLGGFLSSDYMLDLLGYTADTTQRRLGDGLYEQRLIREAIIARTGKRFLVDALTTDEAQFRYLMENAVASKEALNLSVGISLSAEQVAALTHDIVWMEEREVSGAKVLVPVLYLAQANDRLAPTGALIQGSDLALISGGGLHNSGTLRAPTIDMQAMSIANRGLAQADRLSLLAMGDVRNSQGGILKGDSVEVSSLFGDVINERSVATNSGQNGGFTWRDDVVDSAARIEAGSELLIDAGRDLRNTGGVIHSGGDANLYAGRDIRLEAATETDSRQMLFKRAAMSNRQVTQRGGEVNVAGNLDAWAGRDLTVVTSEVKAQGDIDLYANRDLTLAAAANERESDFFRKSSSKKVTTSSMAIEQQGASVEAGGALSLGAGNDLALIGSRARAGGDVNLSAGRDTTIEAAMNESHSDYLVKSKGSLGRKSSSSGDQSSTEAVASVIESGGSIHINSEIDANGALQLTGGRDLNIAGSRLSAEQDISLGALRNLEVTSVLEQQSSSAQRSKSSLLGKSSSTQWQTSSQQAGSELTAGQDLLLVAGDDLRLRASALAAGQDVELHAGVVSGTGNIELLAAQEQHEYYRNQQSKRIGLSSGNMLVSVGSSKRLGESGLNTNQVGAEVVAGRDAILRAAQDISLTSSDLFAGRDVVMAAGRDVQIVSSAEPYWSRSWKSDRKSGIDLQSDGNGFTMFLGSAREKRDYNEMGDRLAPSQVGAGRDLLVDVGRDYRQEGSDLSAGQDIQLRAGRHLTIEAGMESHSRQLNSSLARSGITSNLNHNLDSTLDTIGNTGKGDDATSQVSSVLKTVDTVSQFFAGPTVGDHIGSTSNKNSYTEQSYSARSATLVAGRDIDALAGEDLLVSGGVLEAGRDINLLARDVTLDVARGRDLITQQQTRSQGGINAGASAGSARIGIGGSQGVITGEQVRGNSAPTVLSAGQDINLLADEDLRLSGVRAFAERDMHLTAGRDLTIEAAGIESGVENRRRSGGGEVGIALGGSDFIAIYVSADVGRGRLDREAENQQESYLSAGERLTFTSGRDTRIAGAHLEAEDIIGRVGRDLTVTSLPDTGKAEGKELDASVTVSIGYGTASVSGSVGVGKTNGKTNWVEEQTTLHARDLLDIHVGGHTQVDGALIHSDIGNLKFDTETLAFRDIKGEDREHSWYINGGGSISFGGSGESGGTAGKDGAAAANKAVVTDSSQQGKGNEGSSGWSLSGYDYKRERSQLVRATIGEGQIIVRSDATTGNDSTAGLNRDPSLSQIGLTDKERKTELYVSSTSISRVMNPKETFAEWKAGWENYGKSTVQAYANYGVLADRAAEQAEERPILVPFSMLANGFVDSMNQLNKKSGGAVPGTRTSGGLLAQMPVLLSGDGQLMRVHAPFKEEGGKIKYENGKPVRDMSRATISPFEGFEAGDFLTVNGIMNFLGEAIVNGAMQSGRADFVQFYNPTHGIVGDLSESLFDVLFGTFMPSGISRQMRDVQQQALDQGVLLNNIAHSQGGLILMTALRGVEIKDKEYSRGIIQLSGAPFGAISFHRIAESVGYKSEMDRVFQVNRPDEYLFLGVPKTDSVSDFLGMNFRHDDEPALRFVGSVLSFATLFGKSSSHSNYACWACGEDITEQGREIRGNLPVPVFINKDGSRR
ncbi:hemagglutinin repeat-containing protein [Pseudomonas mangrovi]|nr:hemagglutinin repeat-containing protein [Pseudomonas mangrovi]